VPDRSKGATRHQLSRSEDGQWRMCFRPRRARNRKSVAGHGPMRLAGRVLARQYRPEAHGTESDMVKRARNRNVCAMQALMAIPRIGEWIVFACTETMAQRCLLPSRRAAMAPRRDENYLRSPAIFVRTSRMGCERLFT
jgi:hypothetical protein